jgi:hypothetical protein
MNHPAKAGSRPNPRKLALLVAAAFASGAVYGEAYETSPQALSGLPISFERNEGQFGPDVLFLARGVAGEVAIRYGDISVSPARPFKRDARGLQSPAAPGSALRVALAGANPAPEIEARHPVPTLGHHYRGSSRWENVANYGSVVMRNVYTDIDLAVHGSQGSLEYDFVLAPGANPADIRLKLAADRITLDAQGNLILQVGEDTLRQHAPVAYQERDGQRVAVDARFELHEVAGGTEASFTLGAYDPGTALVIDPVLGYSTYLGGSGTEYLAGLGVDASQNVYVAYASYNGGFTVNLTKFNPATNTHIFTTTLAASGYQVPTSLALGASGAGAQSYITGITYSPDFPNCLGGSGAPDCGSYGGNGDAFVSVVNPSGALVFSRLMGGSGFDGGYGIAVDPNHNFYVTGEAGGGFPTTAGAVFPYQLGASGGANQDAFVAKLNTGAGLVYSTYLGGSGYDGGSAITVDASGRAYVTGATDSFNFPLYHPFDTIGPGVFVTGLSAAGDSLLFSTYLGGSGDFSADTRAIVRHPATGDLTVLGQTGANNFPLVNPIQGYAGGYDVFLTRIGVAIGASGAQFPYVAFSTYLGGSGDDYAGGLALNALGGSGAASSDYWLTGETHSTNFPVVAPIQATLRGASDAFVTHILNDTVTFSTYIGGSGGGAGDEYGNAIALGASGSVYFAGATDSTDFPLVNPYQGFRSGGSDTFVARIDPFIPVPAARRFEWSSDAHPDIIYRNMSTGATYVWRMVGPAFSSDQYVTTIDPSWNLIGHGDFNGDGKNDMVWRNEATGTAYVWYMNNGVFQSDAFLFTIDPIWKVEAVADFNKDGKPDFLFRHQTSGVGFIWYFNDTTPVSDQFLFGIDNSWIVENVGDFNNDGYPDFFFRNTSSGVGFVWYWNGTALGGSNYMFGIDPVWEVVEIADWNLDGNVDLLFRNRDTGLVFVWYTNGTALQGSDFVTQIDPSWKIAPYR